MSYWTHVNGSIQVDSVPLKNEEIKALFKTCKFDSPVEKWEVCNVPRGSEGSLQVLLHFNSGKYETCRVIMTIYGDLRGFEESQHYEILDWIHAVIKSNNMSVRDGVLTINNKTYRYNEVYNDEYYLVSSGFELVHTYKEVTW